MYYVNKNFCVEMYETLEEAKNVAYSYKDNKLYYYVEYGKAEVTDSTCHLSSIEVLKY